MNISHLCVINSYITVRYTRIFLRTSMPTAMDLKAETEHMNKIMSSSENIHAYCTQCIHLWTMKQISQTIIGNEKDLEKKTFLIQHGSVHTQRQAVVFVIVDMADTLLGKKFTSKHLIRLNQVLFWQQFMINWQYLLSYIKPTIC